MSNLDGVIDQPRLLFEFISPDKHVRAKDPGNNINVKANNRIPLFPSQIKQA